MLLATGGTISVGPSGRLGAASLIRMAASGVRGIPADVPVRGEDVSSGGSSQATTESIEHLAGLIRAALADAGCLGVVVTHGTDTLEEVSLACELLVGERDRPVVFTGAMVPPRCEGTDAHENLSSAIRLVADGEVRGTVVVMEHRVHSPLEVRKVATGGREAIASPALGPFGWIGPAGVELVREPTRLGLCSPRLEPGVELVRLVAGGGDRAVRRAAAGARGLVVELFGAGNAGPEVCAGIREAVESGVVVLVCSRVGLGRLTPESGVLEAGALVAEAAGLPLDGLKARVVLMAAIGAGLDRAGVAGLLVSELGSGPSSDRGVDRDVGG